MVKQLLMGVVVFILLCLLVIAVALYWLTDLNRIGIDKSDAALGIEPVASISAPADIMAFPGFTPAATTKLFSGLAACPSSGKAPASYKPVIRSTITPAAITFPPTTIALFGLDRRSGKANSRSDILLLLTMDTAHKKLKLSSLMRDLYVHIDGHGWTKLTHAYAYGGPQLALKTLNENFGLDVRDFCTVDFVGIEKIIDGIGGITLSISADELPGCNAILIEMSKRTKRHIGYIEAPGTQLLNGAQAMVYCRIRHVGRGDFDRTGRQREALGAILNKLKGLGVKEGLCYINTMLPNIETSLTRLQLLELASKCYQLQPIAIEEARFPVDGTFQSGIYSGVYYIKADMAAMRCQLQGYVYRDVQP